MPDKATGVTKVEPEKALSTADPAPVDVKSSVPLEVKITDSSVKALGGDAATPKAPTLESIANSAEPTPVLIAAEQPPVPVIVVAAETPIASTGAAAPTGALAASAAASPPVASVGTTTTTVTSTVPPPVMVTKDEGLVLAPTTTAADDKVTEGQRKINLIWESSQSIISIAITAAVIFCQINAINSETLNNAFFFVVATYLQRTNHIRTGGIPSKANGSYQGR